jgi:hypothetical protein
MVQADLSANGPKKGVFGRISTNIAGKIRKIRPGAA